MTAKILKDVLERVETWRQDAQEELAAIGLEMDAGLGGGVYHATTEEVEDMDRGLKAAREGRLASDEVFRDMGTEIEIRAVVDNPSTVKGRLSACGYHLVDSYEQHDIMFDRPDASLFKSGQKIRLRFEKGAGELTYKGEFQGNDLASRRTEISFPIDASSREQLFLFLQAIGYPYLFQIKKKRELYAADEVKATFDEWPIIGCLLELEGPETEITKLAKSVAPEHEFKNYRLKDLFKKKERDTGLSLGTLQAKFEADAGFLLGRLDLLLD